MTERKHNHAEAFLLMEYRCKHHHTVTIWNSRDGVTPFAIACKTDRCPETAYHDRWAFDRYAPMHNLMPGDYYWRDGTPEEARVIVMKRLEQAVGSDYERPRSEWPAVIEEIISGQEFQPGWPFLDRCLPNDDPTIETERAQPALGAIIWATSGYGIKSREPFVEIHWRDTKVQMDVPSGRELAANILQSCEAAEQDAFLMEWLQQTVGANFESAGRLLLEFREWRTAKFKERGGR